MSLEFLDGFDHYTSVANISRKWDSASGGASAAGRFSGNSWNVFTQSGIFLSGLSNQATRTVGFAFLTVAFGSGSGAGNNLFAFYDGSSIQVQLGMLSTGFLAVSRGGSTVLATSSTPLVTNTWCYIELQVTVGSSGAFTLKINGVTVASGSGVNTQATANAYSNGFKWLCQWANTLVDDLYILNPAGTANNTFLGECRIITGLPNADGSTTQWTPSTGTSHYAVVDETNPNDDTDYNGSATVGQIDLLKFPAISPTGPILAVQTVMTARKDDVGLRQIAEQSKSGATTYTGANTMTLNSSYGMGRQIREVDPATGLPWNLTAFNAAEFGVKVVT